MLIAVMPFAGEVAGLATAVCWSLCSLAFAFAAKRIGALAVNQLRLPMAVALLAAVHLILFGEVWPAAATGRQVLWLTVSGLIGLSLGDLFLLRCFVLIGPRLGHILLTIWPVLAAVMAWPILGEGLSFWAIIGIGVTVGGVAMVLADRAGDDGWQPPAGSKATRTKGVVMGLLGAAGQATGYVTAKLGMQAAEGAEVMVTTAAEAAADPLDPLSATLVRMIAGAVGIWILAALRGHLATTLGAIKDRRAVYFTFIGAALGPVLGVWLSLIAATHTKLGIGATLMATAPILMLPLARITYGDRPGRAAIVGTIVAVGGVGCLFLRAGM